MNGKSALPAGNAPAQAAQTDPKGVFVAALIRAKAHFKPLVKNKTNPHFRSNYADLAQVYEAIDDALETEGFAVLQPLAFDEKGNHVIRTRLVHVGGHEEVSLWPLPGGVKSQELAAAITYGRRYSLSSLIGIAADDEDDDGNLASGRPHGGNGGAKPAQAAPPAKPEKKPEAKPEAKPEGSAFQGTLKAVGNPKNGLWSIETAMGGTFYTVSPEEADVARTAVTTGAEMDIRYHANKKGAFIVDSIEVIE